MTDQRRQRANYFLAGGRAILLISVTCGLALAFLLQHSLKGSAKADAVSMRWIHRWARFSRWLMGIRVEVRNPPRVSGALLCPNHLGYADIVAIGSTIPSYFVTKAEVLNWPLLGSILRRVGMPAVSRRQDKGLAETSERLAHLLRSGHNVTVFLEGTSTGGDRILRFRPPLLQPAIEAGAAVHPVALVWTADKPSIDTAEDVAFWREEHALGPHIWRFLGLRSVAVTVAFGEPVEVDADADRRALAEELRQCVVRLYRENGGHLTEEAPADI